MHRRYSVLLPYLALLLATASWGGLFHVGKYVVSVINPVWFTSLRYVAAAALLLPLLASGRMSAVHLREGVWLRLSGLGFLGYGFFPILVFYGLKYSLPTHGAVIMATMPVTTLLVDWAKSRRRPAANAWLVVCCAVLGVTLVAGLWGAPASTPRFAWLGDLVAWVGTLGWIAYTHGAAGFRDLSHTQYTVWTTVLAAPWLLSIAVLASWGGCIAWPSKAQLVEIVPAMTYVVVAATVGAALTYNFGIRQLGPARGIVFVNAIPITAVLISLALGQIPSAQEWAGIVLVIAALLVHALFVAGKH